MRMQNIKNGMLLNTTESAGLGDGSGFLAAFLVALPAVRVWLQSAKYKQTSCRKTKFVYLYTLVLLKKMVSL